MAQGPWEPVKAVATGSEVAFSAIRQEGLHGGMGSFSKRRREPAGPLGAQAPVGVF